MMRPISLASLLLCAVGGVQPAQAQTTQVVSPSELQLVVFNRPGPRWSERATVTPLLLAHRDLYRGLAEKGEITFSGRFTGEPALGMSIFRAGADQAATRRLLEADPAVTGGYVALEFRTILQSFTRPKASQ